MMSNVGISKLYPEDMGKTFAKRYLTALPAGNGGAD